MLKFYLVEVGVEELEAIYERNCGKVGTNGGGHHKIIKIVPL